MARWIWMIFGGKLWFGHKNTLNKFQIILIIYDGTSFTEIQSEQKLEKIIEKDWLAEMSWFLGYSRDISICTTLPNFSLVESRNQALPTQSARLDRNRNQMVLRNWLDENGSNLEETKDLVIWSHCKNFIPMAQMEMVLPLQCSQYGQNLEYFAKGDWLNEMG